MQWAAPTVALSSAVGFALSTSLQHHTAGAAPQSVEGTWALLGHLLRRPRWLAAQAVGLISFGLHAVALHLGALALVQPVVVSGIVFAVPARAAWGGRRPGGRELRAVALTGLGLAVLLVAAKPTSDHRTGQDAMSVAITGAGLVAAFLIYVLAARARSMSRRSALYGVSAGILFGLVAGLIKLNLEQVASLGVVSLLTSWPLWTLVAAGLGGVAVNQRAYRTAGLSASMPILNIVDVLVALVFGFVVFGEVPAHSLLDVNLQLVALLCLATGLVLIARLEAHPAPEEHPEGLMMRSSR